MRGMVSLTSFIRRYMQQFISLCKRYEYEIYYLIVITCFLSKPPQPQPPNIVPRLSLRREIGQHLSHHRRELEAVAGAGRGDDDLRMARHAAEHEMGVVAHGVEAGLGRARGGVGGGDELRQRRADERLVARRGGAVIGFRVHHLLLVKVL